jgi:hypothetical protein
MKIFSFCIFGDDMKYYFGLRENIRLIREYFPEFHIFIYIGLNRNDDFIDNNISISSDEKIHFIETGKEGIINTMYRFQPILLEDSECVIVRDTDSEINARDRWAIQDFLSDSMPTYSVQIIRDHYWHKSRMMGGLTAFKQVDIDIKNQFKEILKDLDSNNDPIKIEYGFEEKLLSERIYPLIKENALVYSNICIFNGETRREIDFENDGINFCGNVVIYEKGEIEYVKSYQFKYHDYPILKQIYWLFEQGQTELVIELVDEYGFHRIPFHEKPHVLDYVITSLINRNSFDALRECFIKYNEFAKYDITPGVKNQIPTFFKMARSLGYSIVGTCDSEYNPKLMEIVIYFGNYPDDYMALPQSFKIYRHFIFFKDIKIDRFEAHQCWDKIDRIFIMGLEGEFERMHDTWMHLCEMNAPLDRIEEYRAKKDKDLKDIYIGATKNHMDCLKSMKDSQYGCCLFLEDDFVFTSNIRENQKSINTFFSKEYDYNICFLSASKLHIRKEYDDLLLLSNQHCTTSSGYLVSNQSIETVYNKVKEGYDLLLQYPDKSHKYCIDRFWTSLDKLYIFKKKLGFQKPSLSKITGNMNMNLD